MEQRIRIPIDEQAAFGERLYLECIASLFPGNSFEDKVASFKTRKQPGVLYKHAMRSVLFRHCNMTLNSISEIEEVFIKTKPHHSSIINSVKRIREMKVKGFELENIILNHAEQVK